MSQPKLSVLVLPPRVYLPLCRDRNIVPFANDHITEDLVGGSLQSNLVRIPAVLDGRRLRPRRRVPHSQLALLVRPPAEELAVVGDADRVLGPAGDLGHRVMVEPPVDGKGDLEVNVGVLARAMTQLAVLRLAPRASSPDESFEQAIVHVLHEDACSELVLERRGDGDTNQRGDLMLSACDGVDRLQSLEATRHVVHMLRSPAGGGFHVAPEV
mmetsp:Transcript_21292/g.48044  ORF Transcript_21292/g.48044 Transcript_21292/m.48044 type:complete len:213 (-) Transcript_21292:1675-2313(-)